MNAQTNKLHTSALHHPSSATATGIGIGQDMAGRRSQVDEATNETTALLNQLQDLVNALNERLESVLVPESAPPPAAAPMAPAAPYRVLLADKISITNGRLCVLVRRLEDMLPRIEL